MKKLFIFFAIFFSVSTVSFGQNFRLIRLEKLLLASPFHKNSNKALVHCLSLPIPPSEKIIKSLEELLESEINQYNQKYLISKESNDILNDVAKGLNLIIDDPLTSGVLKAHCEVVLNDITSCTSKRLKALSLQCWFIPSNFDRSIRYLNLHDETRPFVPMLERVQKELSEKAEYLKMEIEVENATVHQVKKDKLSEHVQYMKEKYMNESAVE